MIPAIYNNIKEQRLQWLAWEKERDEKYRIPDGVEVIRDLALADPSCDPVDVYLPDGFDEKSDNLYPVLINIHGGGMVMGTKHQNLGICCELAAQGFLVIGIDYPLVPESTIPGELESIARTLDAITDLLPVYHGDSERVFLSGDSAGAFLSVYTTGIANSPKLAAAFSVVPTKLRILGLGLSSGMYYSTKVETNGIFLLLDSFYGKGWKKSAFASFLDPENSTLLSVLPPCFLSTSRGDFLKKHTLRFEKALTKAGIPHEFVLKEEKVEHAFNALYPEWPESIDVNRRMGEYLMGL